MIEDAELRELFQVECEEHLQALDEGLLRLESNPHHGPALEEVFRAAHSLKGTARMLGVTGVEAVAHHLEDELGSAKRGRETLTPAHIDRLSVGLHAIRRLVEEAVTGTRADVDVNHVLAQLAGTAPLEKQAPLKTALDTLAASAVTSDAVTSDAIAPDATAPFAISLDAQPQIIPAPLSATVEISLPHEQSTLEAVALPASDTAESPDGSTLAASREDVPQALVEFFAAESDDTSVPALSALDTPLSATEMVHRHAPATGEKGDEQLATTESASLGADEQGEEARRDDFKIQTMRVPPAKLDALMAMSSELTVTATRVVRGLSAFEEIGALWDEWNKDMNSQRTVLNSLERGQLASGESVKTLAAFYAREQTRLARLNGLWEQLKGATFQDVARLNFVAGELEDGIRNVRLLPLSQIFNLFPRLVRDLTREQGKDVQFVVEGGETAADKRILEELKDPLMHMLRNAIDHGIEAPDDRSKTGKPRAATIRLRASQTATNIHIELRDDGRGLDVEAIKRTALKRRLHSEDELAGLSREQIWMLIFAPGFSTSPLVTDVSGRGVGMDVVRTNVERLKGGIRVESEPGRGTTFTLRLPSTLATTRVLLVACAGRPFALPIEWVDSLVRVPQDQVFTVEGRHTTVLNGRPLPLARLNNLLELPVSTTASAAAQSTLSAICVVLSNGDDRLGVLVEELLDEQEIVLKPPGALLKRVRNVAGVTILGAGEICPVLHPQDLIKSAQKSTVAPSLPAASEETTRRKVVLLVEDSITTRTQEKRILESAGYEVVTAVDGADAWSKLASRDFDVVVSDVEMPNLDGLGLAARIRENARYNELPIVLVTSLASDADKRRGVEVGANAYLTKGTFEQKALLDTLKRLV